MPLKCMGVVLVDYFSKMQVVKVRNLKSHNLIQNLRIKSP